MATRTPRNSALVPPAQRVPATRPIVEPDDPAPPAFDVNGFDPSEFEWRPVPRRPRGDGWTPDVQRAFIQALADTGMVEHAARAVGMSVQSAYRLRHAPGGESFARAWTAALAAAAERVLDLAFQRAVEGEDTPVFDRDGCRIGSRRKTSDRLTMFILRAYLPDRFRHAHQDVRPAGERPAPATLPVAEALAALAPVTPAAPHRLMPPDRLAGAVETARALAEVDRLYPPDDRQRYIAPRVEDDHPAATARARGRRTREAARHLYDDHAQDDD